MAKCHILINYWCREYGIDYFSYNTHNNSCIHDLDSNSIKGAFEMTEKRYSYDAIVIVDHLKEDLIYIDGKDELLELAEYVDKLQEENEELKKGMIGVVDRYIKNVECNPPSSTRTYGKIKRTLINIREDLRNLIGDLE